MESSPRGYPNAGINRSQVSSLANSHTNRQLMQANGYPSKLVIEDLVSSHGSLKRDMIRNDETLQAIRQENIMLAEKVQQATNLYRQLLGRVSKTEERMQLEHKSVTAVISQAKTVEQQMVHQQEQLNSKESQLAIQIQRLQEEVGLLKNEKESTRKQFNTMTQDIRQLQDRVVRQTSTLSTGLQELRTHLDQREQERSQNVSSIINELREKVDTITHEHAMFKTQAEGRIETVRLQANQFDKQRQDDIYQLTTVIREKEALTKADTRRLQEKVKELFEEFNKQIGQREVKLKQDVDSKIMEIDKKIQVEAKQHQREIKDSSEELTDTVNELREVVSDEVDILKSKIKENQISISIIEQLQDEMKAQDKSINQNKKEIEKIVRAEITSRLSQGEKLSRQIDQMHKEHNEGVTLMQETLGDAKRRQEQAIETNKRDMVRMINEGLKAHKANLTSNQKFDSIEKKIEDMEDALDEFAKLDERIEMNSERIKQIEMENILAQGDIHASIDGAKKQMKNYAESLTETKDDMKSIIEELERKDEKLKNAQEQYVIQIQELVKRLKNENDILPSQIKVLEKRIQYVSENVEAQKQIPSSRSSLSDDIMKPSPPAHRRGTPLPRHTESRKINKLEDDIDGMREIVTVLHEVLSSIVEEKYQKNVKDKLAKELKDALEKLGKKDDPEETNNENQETPVNETEADESGETETDSDDDDDEELDDDTEQTEPKDPNVASSNVNKTNDKTTKLRHPTNDTNDKNVPNDDKNVKNSDNATNDSDKKIKQPENTNIEHKNNKKAIDSIKQKKNDKNLIKQDENNNNLTKEDENYKNLTKQDENKKDLSTHKNDEHFTKPERNDKDTDKSLIEQDKSTKYVPKQDENSKFSNKKDKSPKDSIKQDKSPKDSTKQDKNVKDSTKQDKNVNDSTKQDKNANNTTKQNKNANNTTNHDKISSKNDNAKNDNPNLE